MICELAAMPNLKMLCISEADFRNRSNARIRIKEAMPHLKTYSCGFTIASPYFDPDFPNCKLTDSLLKSKARLSLLKDRLTHVRERMLLSTQMI